MLALNRCRLFKAGQAVKKGGFSASGRSLYSGHRAEWHIDAHAAQGPDNLSSPDPEVDLYVRCGQRQGVHGICAHPYLSGGRGALNCIFMWCVLKK
jgi:hypothetical protein